MDKETERYLRSQIKDLPEPLCSVLDEIMNVIADAEKDEAIIPVCHCPWCNQEYGGV